MANSRSFLPRPSLYSFRVGIGLPSRATAQSVSAFVISVNQALIGALTCSFVFAIGAYMRLSRPTRCLFPLFGTLRTTNGRLLRQILLSRLARHDCWNGSHRHRRAELDISTLTNPCSSCWCNPAHGQRLCLRRSERAASRSSPTVTPTSEVITRKGFLLALEPFILRRIIFSRSIGRPPKPSQQFKRIVTSFGGG